MDLVKKRGSCTKVNNNGYITAFRRICFVECDESARGGRFQLPVNLCSNLVDASETLRQSNSSHCKQLYEPHKNINRTHFLVKKILVHATSDQSIKT